MFANTDRERHLIRRLARCTFVASMAVTIAAGPAESQDVLAQSELDYSKPDDPPPLDNLLKSLPSSRTRGLSDEEYRELHPSFRCQSSKLSCNDPIAFGAQGMYTRIRECWHPPIGTKTTTAIFLGQTAAPPYDPVVVTLSFTLKTDGTLNSLPQLDAPAALGNAVNDLVRAVEHCQPYDMLPRDKYPDWKDVVMRIRIELNPHLQREKPEYFDKPKQAPSDAFRG